MLFAAADSYSLRSSPASNYSDQPPIASVHVREGAFAPSTKSDISVIKPSLPIDINRPKGSMEDLVADVGNAIDDVGLICADDVPPPTVVEPLRVSEDSIQSREGLGMKREESWVSITPEDVPRVLTPNSDDTGVSVDSGHSLFRRSSSRSPPKMAREICDDTSPSSTPRHLRSTLTANLKRFSSLPRTPSRRSEKRLSGGSRSSTSTLPPPPEVPEPSELSHSPAPFQKIISPWPSAMFYAEILSKKSALERSQGYAAKINELYIHDCGLGEFLVDTQHRGKQPAQRFNEPC